MLKSPKIEKALFKTKEKEETLKKAKNMIEKEGFILKWSLFMNIELYEEILNSDVGDYTCNSSSNSYYSFL